MNKTIVAIDPGASGGIAWQHSGGTPACMKMPDTEGDILQELRIIFHMSHAPQPPVVYIEELTGFCGVKIPSHTMMKLGRNVGFLHGTLAALGFRIVPVSPAAWQKSFGLGTARSCGSKTVWKNKLKAKAQQLYPNQNVTLSTADALLILEHGVRVELSGNHS